jgi:hypothetical protein
MLPLASRDETVFLKAREAIASAQTVEQLRQAQAVVLPLDYAMSLADMLLARWMFAPANSIV